MAAFYFKAVAADGKLRTGTLSGETEKAVASELRRQGLVPVYVGAQSQARFRLRLPTIVRGKRKDVLFFTQELATLLRRACRWTGLCRSPPS
jgi:type II secretory pathway component PulF